MKRIFLSFAALTLFSTATFAQSISGSFNVGTGQTYTTLTAAVADLNIKTVTGPVVFNLTDTSYPSETFPIVINANVGSSAVNTVTIKPAAGAIPTISGSNATTIVDLNGCKFMIIDGFNGGTGDLTLRNTSATGATVRFISDASNNTLTNTLVEGATASPTNGVVFFSSGTVTGNINNTVSLNLISDRTDAAGVPANLLYSAGTSAAIPNRNNSIFANHLKNFTAGAITMTPSAGNESWAINENLIFQSGAQTTPLVGISFASLGTNTITHNTIHDLTTSAAATGIELADARATTVSRNSIRNFASTSGSTGTLIGINSIGSAGNPASVTLVNNFISIVPSFTNAQTIKGIQDAGPSGNTFTADFNTVFVGGTASGSSSSWAMLRTTSAPDTYTMRNNIAFNKRTGGTGNHFAGGDQSANTGTLVSNFNFFAGTGAPAANFMDYGTSASGTAVSFATWTAGPPARDANSIANTAATYPVGIGIFFGDANNGDLHLRKIALGVPNPAENAGTPLGSVTTDYDNDTRDASTPDIGADEMITMQFSSATYSVAENVSGGLATITVTRTPGAGNFTTIDYARSDGTATGGASCGGATDYVSAPVATFSFAPGETTKTFNVPICNDSVFEGDETVNLKLSSAIGPAIQDAPADAVLTITNDDAAPSFSIDDVTHGEGDAGTTSYTFTVTKTGSTALSSSVDFQTQDGTATLADNDYQSKTGTLNFSPTDTTKTITVLVNGDTTNEANEAFVVHLSNANGATISDADGTGTITNDDAAPSFSINDVTHNEGDAGTTSYTFTVTKTGSTALSSSVDYQTVNGTAVAPGDFTAIPATTLIFGPSDTTMQVTVLVNGDTTNEPNETFTVHLSNASGATIGNADGTGTITNDDAAPSFSIDDVTHNEGDAGTTSYTFTVTKTGSTALSSSVDYETVNGSATAPSDFTAIPVTTLTFGPTDTSTQITVSVNGDTTIEPNEDFTVHLSNASGATISDADGTGTITNDDVHVAPVVTNTNDNGVNSLRQALLDALDGDTITFNIPTGDPGYVDGVWTISLTTGELVVDKDVMISGLGANVLVVQRSPAAGNFRVFHVTSGLPRGSAAPSAGPVGVTIQGITISNGHPSGSSFAAAGGGIYNDHTSLAVNSCTLSGNTSEFVGGGLFNDVSSGSGNVAITNCTLNGNSAGFGGGIYNYAISGSGNMTITNCTLSGNSAQYGGGIYSSGVPGSGNLTLTNSTLSGNSASVDGNSIYDDGPLMLGNTILKIGTAGANIFKTAAGIVTSSGYNLSNDNGGGFLTGTGDQINTDPILGPLKNNGGPTFTHAPLSNSPAIDKGKDTGATGQDQRGSVRPVTYDVTITPPAGGDRSDIGAVELSPGVLPVNAVSRKTHTGVGDFDINLPLTGVVGVECRSGGATNDYKVIVIFALPVTFNSAAVNDGTGSVASTTGSGTNIVTMNLTGVSNAQRITLALFGVDNTVSSGDVGVRMGMLIGDTNNSGGVTAADVGQTKAQSGLGTTGANFRTDVNASGSISAADIGLVKSRSGTALPP